MIASTLRRRALLSSSASATYSLTAPSRPQPLLSRAFHSIPVIDIQALVQNASKVEKEAVAAELDRACREVGFFYVSNHGVDEKLLHKVRSLSREWFSLSTDVKEEIRLTNDKSSGFRGYQSLGSNVTRYDGGFQRDWHEAIDLYKDFSSTDSAVLAKRPLHAPNPWPTHIPGYTEALKEYVEECKSLGSAIMRGIALGMKLDEHFFEGDRAGDSFWVTRVIHYPPLGVGARDEASKPQPAEDDSEALAAAQGEEVDRSVQLSCGEHTDYGLLTLVNQDSHISALQVKNAAGEWVQAPPLPGTLVCNIGDMLKVWSNGAYQPTLHRVIHLRSSKSRISVPFFFEPNFDAVVEPLPQFCSPENGPKYPSVVYGDHLQSKVFSNFEI